MHERDIFITALQKQTDAAQRAYLNEACGRDAALRLRVEDLLRTHGQLGEFLESPAPGIAELGEACGAGEPAAIRSGVHVGAFPSQVLGDFRIVREIGRGGMGVVYEAEQISLARRVALKLLPFAAVLDERQLKRFKNEALAAAQLDHPNIVSVLGVGCERGVHYYAMRYVEGQTLAQLICNLRRQNGIEPEPDRKPATALAKPAGSPAPQDATDVDRESESQPLEAGVPDSSEDAGCPVSVESETVRLAGADISTDLAP